MFAWPPIRRVASMTRLDGLRCGRAADAPRAFVEPVSG